MSLLRRLVTRGFRAGAAAPAHIPDPPNRSAQPAAGRSGRPVAAMPPSDRALKTLAQEILHHCTNGNARAAASALDAGTPPPQTPQEAVRALTVAVMPSFVHCLGVGDAATAADLENVVYGRLIRRFEDATHHEACFDLLDEVMHELGVRASAAVRSPAGPPARVNRLLFFLHNLSHDLASLVLLCDLLEAYLSACPEDAGSIGLVGTCNPAPSPRVSALQRKWGIDVFPLPPRLKTKATFDEAAALLSREGFDRLVFTAIPFGLSYMSGLLDPWRLGWLSMKFELASFKHLQNRCSFATGVRRTCVVRGRAWHQAPPLLTGEVELRGSGKILPALAAARRFATVFYTVNREEKIRHPDFIDAVARILEEVPDSSFVWTGQAAPSDVTERLAARGLADRHFFAGWVTPDDLVLGADIFLDTPVLSGAVAARAVAAGRPVVTMPDSRSWVGVFRSSHGQYQRRDDDTLLDQRIDALEARGILLECASKDQYIAQAVQLAKDPGLRSEFGEALGAFARKYFFNARSSAIDHLANLRL